MPDPIPALPKHIAALVFDLAASTDGYPAGCNAHITPDGPFRADDGRPRSMEGVAVDDWLMNAEIAAALIAAVRGKPILYDYDHNSLWGDTRAAGWIVDLVYVAGRGLFGRVEWTPRGAREIADKEFRYSSPLFTFNPQTGAITELLSVALTNNPALGDLGAVDLVRRAALAALPLGALANQFLNVGESLMTPEQLAALTAERDGLKSTVASLTAERDGLKTQVAALTTERDGLKTQVAALTSERDGLIAAQAQAALAAEQTEHATLLAAALSGDQPRLVPAQKAWAEKLSLAALKEYLEATGPVALAAQQSAPPAGDGRHGLSQDERALCAKMGVTAEQFAAAKQSQA